MARKRINDLLQNYPFWLIDIQPSSRIPFLVLGGPLFGFSAISHPEIQVNTEEINQLNSAYPEHAFMGASIAPITLTRGSRFYDSTMFTWIDRFIQGEDIPHRDLLLIQHMGLGGFGVASPGPSFIEIIRVPGKAWMLWDCLDDETEILTSEGWRGSDGVEEGNLVYSMNLETGMLELVPIDGYVRREATADDSMVSIEGRRFNFRVTGRHGFYLRSTENGPLKRFEASSLLTAGGERSVPVSGEMADGFKGVDLTDDELRLIAWFVTDGHMKEGQRLMISQSKEYHHEIRDLLTRMELHFTERPVPGGSYPNSKPGYLFGVPKGTGPKELRGWIKYEPYLDKKISPLLHDMTKRQFEVFWRELVKGDGCFLHEDEEGWINNSQLWCSMKEQADTLMWMATIRGIAVSCYQRATENGHEMFCLTARDRQWMAMRLTRMVDGNENPLTESKPRDGEYVWCVSNRNKTIITRRCGKITILGNCIPTRYTPGPGLDATSGEVTLAELDIQPVEIEEFSLDPTRIIDSLSA